MATSRPSGAAWHASGRTDVERNCYQPQRKQRPHLPLCLRQYSNWWTSGWRRRTGPYGPRRWPEHSPAEAEVDSEPCGCQKIRFPNIFRYCLFADHDKRRGISICCGCLSKARQSSERIVSLCPWATYQYGK